MLSGHCHYACRSSVIVRLAGFSFHGFNCSFGPVHCHCHWLIVAIRHCPLIIPFRQLIPIIGSGLGWVGLLGFGCLSFTSLSIITQYHRLTNCHWVIGLGLPGLARCQVICPSSRLRSICRRHYWVVLPLAWVSQLVRPRHWAWLTVRPSSMGLGHWVRLTNTVVTNWAWARR